MMMLGLPQEQRGESVEKTKKALRAEEAVLFACLHGFIFGGAIQGYRRSGICAGRNEKRGLAR